MADIQIAILGLGRLGASIGLALKRYNQSGGQHTFHIVGYDRSASTLKMAQEIDAVHEIEKRPFNAVRNRDIVVIATPFTEVKDIYQLISQDVRDGVVILDTSLLKQPSHAWAKNFLSDNAHVIGIVPIVNPKYLFDGVDETARATEDLFDNGSMLLMPGVRSVKEAIELATNFATLLGAAPNFYDAAEYDALISATEVLPDVLGVAYFYMMTKNRGWGDVQRLTNATFAMATHQLYDTHPDDIRDSWLSTRENLARYLDDYIHTLQEFRATLAREDKAALEAAVIGAAEDY